MNNIVDTPTGFVVGAPWPVANKALVIELKCHLASLRSQTNILSSRVSVRSANNSITDETFAIPVDGNPQAQAVTYTARPGNSGLVVSANRRVRMYLTLPGSDAAVDMGLVTIFLLDTPFVKVVFVNTENTSEVQVNLIAV